LLIFSGKKRGRGKQDEDVVIPKSSDTFVLDERQFQEIRKEHKKNRKLIRDQYQEFEVLTQYELFYCFYHNIIGT
jgi:hypothetical protein